MDSKLALVDCIEDVKEKLTSGEYRTMLELLAKIKVNTNSESESEEESESESESESGSETSAEDREYERIRQRRRRQIPDIQIRVWNGTEVVEHSSRSYDTGFARPTKISNQLATFLGIPEGVLIARPDVTKGITKYVKDHDLQKTENKRIIDLDKPGGQALRTLLNVPNGTELTFFNLQMFLKIHFPSWYFPDGVYRQIPLD